MGTLIVAIVIAIFIGTFIFAWKEGKVEGEVSSKELLERIKCSDIKRIDFRIRGIAFLSEESRQMVFSLMPTDTLYLRREPWNPVDSNAVAVFRGDEKIGYVEKPINKVILKYISSDFMYNCCFAYKERNDKDYMEYYCSFFIESKGSNDKLPAGVQNPTMDNILTNPRIEFPFGKENYDFYDVPGEWIFSEYQSYGKKSKLEVKEDPDTRELYDANKDLISDFLNNLYLLNEKTTTVNDVIRKYRELFKKRYMEGWINKYLATHDIFID